MALNELTRQLIIVPHNLQLNRLIALRRVKYCVIVK